MHQKGAMQNTGTCLLLSLYVFLQLQILWCPFDLAGANLALVIVCQNLKILHRKMKLHKVVIFL